ncbi:MAG: WecB/TagA/CpsF family glycosyltransferase [Gammaproteobacteria bacterium]|nr:WecB/TagA/CpsF family glycosyltransferase [Gammaproteobacteria bacterium]
MTELPRHQILDCMINCTDMPQAQRSVHTRLESGDGGYVCFANVHTVVTARDDMTLRDATNHSFMSMPDGGPLAMLAKRRGIKHIERVSGPDFMWRTLDEQRDKRHFFYGSTRPTLDKLESALQTQFPGLIVAGTLSPPFRELDADESTAIHKQIREARPDYIWVGLGAPKQEYWMAENWQALQPAILLGVGAAFDFLSGTKARAPRWMRRLGMEWLFRLLNEPRRLGWRYLSTNTRFLYFLVREAVSGTRH